MRHARARSFALFCSFLGLARALTSEAFLCGLPILLWAMLVPDILRGHSVGVDILVLGLVVHDELVVHEVEAVRLVLKGAGHLWGTRARRAATTPGGKAAHTQCKGGNGVSPGQSATSPVLAWPLDRQQSRLCRR